MTNNPENDRHLPDNAPSPSEGLIQALSRPDYATTSRTPLVFLVDREPLPNFPADSIEQARITTRERKRMGISAIYRDYYNRVALRFYETDDIPGSLPQGVVAIPRSQWENYHIVQSGTNIYAEPVTTTKLEQGAVVYAPDSIIAASHEKLDRGGLTSADLIQTLRMLGVLPFGASETIPPIIRDLDIESSVIEDVSNLDDSHTIIHTPHKGVDLQALLEDKAALLQAQRAGRVESILFSEDGMYAPIGISLAHDGVIATQVRWLRRQVVGPSLSTNHPSALPPAPSAE